MLCGGLGGQFAEFNPCHPDSKNQFLRKVFQPVFFIGKKYDQSDSSSDSGQQFIFLFILIFYNERN